MHAIDGGFMAENAREPEPHPIDKKPDLKTPPPIDVPQVDEKTSDDLIAEDRFEGTDN